MTLPEHKNYPQLGEVKAPYVHAVKHGATLYVSGLTAFGTAAQQGDIAEQAETIFEQLKAVAAAERTSLAALREVLYRHYGEHLPASSLVQVSGLFSTDLRIEIEAIFAL